ncbi:hypothetical protein WMY93_020476 [Mugilogobius chulae]|uniref:Uncharacterized protein n=1 Tax=Mugilogobius chulae TaxID=88201 RepID=A0AAW0NIC5_9GOBI
MEREVVRQEQRVPPGRLPLHSRPSGGYPPRTPSPRVPPQQGSPRRAPRRVQPQSPLLEHCRTRRTSCSLQGLVAKSSLYSRHLDHRACVGLLERPLPGLRAPWAQCGAADSLRSHHNRFTPLSSLPAQNKSLQAQTSISSPGSEEDIRPAQSPDKDKRTPEQVLKQDPDKRTPEQVPKQDPDPPPEQKLVHASGAAQSRSDPGWTWTVGQNMFTAQWVKQKQQYRSTRPW